MRAVRTVSLLLFPLLAVGCGSKSGLLFGGEVDPLHHHPGEDGGDPAVREDGGPEAGVDAGLDAGLDSGPDAGDTCLPELPGCGDIEICGNGGDDDCDGEADEGCNCVPGDVQRCFPAPPGNRDVGACTDGQQTCEASETWGPCDGAIVPREDVCNGTDNLCNSCSAQRDCPIDCPSPGDPRVEDGEPLRDYALRGRDFYEGAVSRWRWSVEGGPCDEIAANLESFDLSGSDQQNATLTPALSGDYTVRLDVTTANGTQLGCEWVVHVRGPGLRIEMCYPESEQQDLDLYLHRPDDVTPWYPPGVTAFFPSGPETCGWHNCEATIRGEGAERVDWGYEPSELSACESGPHGPEWRQLGECTNPRLDIDNNLGKASGVPENINLDNPHDGETFRIMVQNFTGERAHPVVNVYCGGTRVATYGASPDELPRFEGTPGEDGVGAMWRVADVTTFVDDDGVTTGCDSVALHPPLEQGGYDVTQDDPRY